MKYSRSHSLKSLLLGVALIVGAGLRASGAALPASPAGLAVSVDESTGAYTVTASRQHWTFTGSVGAPLSHVAVTKGHDRLGDFQEVSFQWRGAALWGGTIRDYQSRPLVSFGITAPQAVSGPTPDFPDFTTFPQSLHTLSFQDSAFSPAVFRLSLNATPWFLFDDKAQTAVLSPASDFLVSQMHGDGKASFASGLNAQLTSVPAGFQHLSFLAVGQGIGETAHAWGDALTGLSGKTRPADDADVLLKYLGYWTDNGAVYYYNYDPDKGYTGTLLALRQQYAQEKIPIHYMQLDSWWYQKSLRSYNGVMGKTKNPALPVGTWNAYGGTLDYTASPALFPQGLASFQKQLALPMAVHGRWLDPTGPYAQTYKLSGVAPVDPRWWDERMAYLKASGVTCYEQDWLSEIYKNSPEMARTLETGPAFADNMARAAQQNGLTLQYCMATPRFFLQGTRYPNLTTIRTSDDRFEYGKWRNFLYTSLLAASLHVRPWADVFMSTEMGNLTLATLSAGPVGTGDKMGRESRENLLRAVRADGVIVKPDAPLTPTDDTILADARQEHTPLIAATQTDNGLQTAYVFACMRTGDAANVSFTPASLGLSGTVYVYSTFDKTAMKLAASDSFTGKIGQVGWMLDMVAPVGRSGIAFLGDMDKIVCTGRQRIPSVRDEPGRLTVTVTLAPGDGPVTLHGYAASAPSVSATGGTATPITFDTATGHFSTQVSAGGAHGQTHEGASVNQMTVTFRTRP
jgi:hypothetical protein